MPNIAVLNSSTSIADKDIKPMLPAFQTQWNRDLVPVWNVEPAKFSFIAKGRKPAPGDWWLVFLDNSDQAGALAYHDLTKDGMPLSKVFVESLQKDSASLSVGVTHEILEMAVDPWLNSAYQDARGTFWAGEICDPVEDDQYGYEIDGVLVSDFVTPNWFAHRFAKGPYDFKQHALGKFEVLSGGYAQTYDPVKGWVQVSGPKAKASARYEASEGSRRERRTRDSEMWVRSDAIDRALSDAKPARAARTGRARGLRG